jgi:hypothetical protein
MKTTKRKKSLQFENKPTNKTPVSPPSAEEIRRRAHQIFLARGGVPGKELDDWLQAEHELKYPKSRKNDGDTSATPVEDLMIGYEPS